MRRGLESELGRLKIAITHTSDWPAREGAAEDDVAQWWTHVVTLHRKKRTLNKELKEAERALGEEPSEANLGLDPGRSGAACRHSREPRR